MIRPRLLVVLPQLPRDAASGAARSMHTIAGMAAAHGFEVRVLATTATESHSHRDALAELRVLGLKPRLARPRGARQRPEVEYGDGAVHCHLLDTGNRAVQAWEAVHGRQFDLMFDDELRDFRPDLLFTYGGSPGDGRRRQRARRQGVKVVFALHNHGYLAREFFTEIDAVLTPSRFLSERYRGAIGIESTALPLPIDVAEAVAGERDPIFFTMINPSPEKGLMLVARLAEELSVRRPDIPLLVIEGRGSGGQLVRAGLAGGFDLQRHANIMISSGVPLPKDIYEPARAVLVPSLWEEPAGRVVAEALLNGVPPLVSDRGGLPEVANGAGMVVPVPAGVGPEAAVPVAAEVVEPWIEPILRLESDPDFYQQQCAAALQAGAIYRPEALAPRYAAYFQSVLDA